MLSKLPVVVVKHRLRHQKRQRHFMSRAVGEGAEPHTALALKFVYALYLTLNILIC
jgi:hypothetical protein